MLIEGYWQLPNSLQNRISILAKPFSIPKVVIWHGVIRKNNPMSKTTPDSLAEVKWRIRKGIRQSALSGVNRRDFHIFICNWSHRPEGPGAICEEIRSMFRAKERNAFLPSDLASLFTSAGETPSRETIFQQIARTSDVIFILYNHQSATEQLGQPASVVLSEITPSLPDHIRNRVRPLSFHHESKVDLPHMPGEWSTTPPRFTDLDTLLKRVRMMAASIRADETQSPGERWYDTTD